MILSFASLFLIAATPNNAIKALNDVIVSARGVTAEKIAEMTYKTKAREALVASSFAKKMLEHLTADESAEWFVSPECNEEYKKLLSTMDIDPESTVIPLQKQIENVSTNTARNLLMIALPQVAAHVNSSGLDEKTLEGNWSSAYLLAYY